MKKYLLIPILAGVIILGGCAVKNNSVVTPSVPNNVANPVVSSTPASNSNNVATAVYKNTFGGYQLTFPNQLWVLPSVTDEDPHFYADADCAKLEVPDCPTFEIQAMGYPIEQGAEAYFQSLKRDGSNPVKLSSLISGAIMYKFTDPTAEGWSYEYAIFFLAEKKSFLAFADNSGAVESILPTFKLLK